MYIHPLVISVFGAVLLLLIGVLGYFLKRTIDKQDKRNDELDERAKEQSEINSNLTTCIQDLNKTMATFSEAFKWMREGCAERHQRINHRLKVLEKQEP